MAPRDRQHRDDGHAARVCIVAVRPETFERCQEGFYPAPATYDRTDTPFEYMAFYRTAPISAVTHYARVTDRIRQERGKAGPMDESDWGVTVDPFTDASAVVVFELDELVPLDTPIENDRQGVRGAWYCSLAILEQAGTLSDLAAQTGE